MSKKVTCPKCGEKGEKINPFGGKLAVYSHKKISMHGVKVTLPQNSCMVQEV